MISLIILKNVFWSGNIYSMTLTHCCLMMPYGIINFAWWHQAITWTNGLLTYYQCRSVAFTWQQFHRKPTKYQFINRVWKLHFRKTATSPRGQWVYISSKTNFINTSIKFSWPKLFIEFEKVKTVEFPMPNIVALISWCLLVILFDPGDLSCSHQHKSSQDTLGCLVMQDCFPDWSWMTVNSNIFPDLVWISSFITADIYTGDNGRTGVTGINKTLQNFAEFSTENLVHPCNLVLPRAIGLRSF